GPATALSGGRGGAEALERGTIRSEGANGAPGTRDGPDGRGGGSRRRRAMVGGSGLRAGALGPAGGTAEAGDGRRFRRWADGEARRGATAGSRTRAADGSLFRGAPLVPGRQHAGGPGGVRAGPGRADRRRDRGGGDRQAVAGGPE